MLLRFSTGGILAVLLAVVCVNSAQSQEGRGRGFSGFGGGSSMASLLGNEAVQKELGLEGAALEKAKALRDEYRAEVQKAMPEGSFQGLRDLPRDQQAAKLTEFRQKTTEASAKAAAAVNPKIKEALSAQQYERLQQIQWQAAGIAALSDAELVKALDISKEQSEKIAALEKENSDKQRELFRGGFNEEAREKMTALIKERDAKVNEVLTAAQRDKFAQLKGKEFDLASLRSARGRDRNKN